MIGKTLGHYQITGQLGKGGMGEVYRAKDSNLGRDVAIKVLPEEFAKDAKRIARFQREAKLLASLNHPNIAAIYGLEESRGTNFLVLELVEGETLADQLTRGPIPVEESLKLVLQIAEALEAAHEKGIIHRDLKPANIKITPEDKVKVLDFGLAKAMEGEAAEPDGSQSPTISIADTKAGIILGTAAYMSPEQARGSGVDKRCDIWSFGIVLFEMLAGKKLFAGETISDTLAAVLRAEVDLNLLPRDTPASIRTLLRRCLTKDRRQRLQAIGDARIAIEECSADPAGASVLETGIFVAGHRLRERLAWGGAVLLLVSALTVLGVLYFRQTPVEMPEIQFHIMTPPTSDPDSLAISPDGRLLAFVASAEGKQRLWLRPLDKITAQPLDGTEDATLPFWSPDSRSIGFCADLKLKRIDIAGRAPQVLASAPDCGGGTWNRDGIIVFSPSRIGVLYRIPSAGGAPVAITHMDPMRQTGHVLPQFLPDGHHLLFIAGGGAEQGVYLTSVESAETRKIVATESAAAYAAPGYLLFRRQGTLFAQHFDATRGEVAGDPVPVAGSAASRSDLNMAGFSVSETGLLAYRTGSRLLRGEDLLSLQILPPSPETGFRRQRALQPADHRPAKQGPIAQPKQAWHSDRAPCIAGSVSPPPGRPRREFPTEPAECMFLSAGEARPGSKL
jgi:hypothetical protein